MSEETQKFKLDNGLTVLLKEIHTAPLISHWIWYRVGSRDEIPGITGASHWVEHMQFKGTPRHPAAILDRTISRVGGVWNAMTFLDWTAYFETLPANQIDLALDLESDRMLNSAFDPDEVNSERTVIISERQGNENNPLFQLGEQVQAAAFQIHPYHHEVIGELADLQTMDRDDLYNHYRTYYVPNNAVLAIAGDFTSDEMIERINKHYDSLAPGSEPARRADQEPPLTGEHRLTVEGPGETTFLEVAYRAPAATDSDFFAYTVLDSLLTGPSNLNLFGGGISNKTSRLYRALVERELAVGVFGGLQATIDPFLHNITLTVHPQRTVEEALAGLDQELKQLRSGPPPAEELARAVKQARALFAYGSESITNQAFWLGYAEMFASHDWFVQYLARLEAITPKDVLRVAQAYLHPENRVVGVYLPGGDGNAAPPAHPLPVDEQVLP